MKPQLSLLCFSLLLLHLVSASYPPPDSSFDSSSDYYPPPVTYYPPPATYYPSPPATYYPPPGPFFNLFPPPYGSSSDPYPPPDTYYQPPSPPADSSDDDAGEEDDYVYYTSHPAPCDPEDKKNLLRIKLKLNNPIHLSRWNNDTDCCNSGWQGIWCNQTSGRVINLSFNRNDAEHSTIPPIFPPAIGFLPYLRELQFRNNVTGPIPPTIAYLRNLITLDLSYNRFKGNIPDFIRGFPNINYLDLSHNQLSGPIPSYLSEARNLRYLSLNNNKLTGCIPDTLFQFPKINNPQFDADFSNNRLNGSIPTSWESVNFRSLRLSHNRLTGDALFLFRNLNLIRSLDLSWNMLSFNMSKAEIPFRVTSLDLRKNKIFGSLPLTSNMRLNEFNASYNHLCGQIPPGFQHFNQSAFFHNKLCGTPMDPCKKLYKC